MSTDLFSPLDLGRMHLPNRVVMAPMTRSRATADHVPAPIMADYYASRADGGLLITEGVGPEPAGTGYPRIPGLWSDAQIAAWRVVTDAVHAAGGRIVAQIMHTGRVGHPLNMPEGSVVKGPSEGQVSGEMYTDQQGPQPYPVAQAMDEADIERALDSFAAAARKAVAAGFDGIELHGANGYLIDQFISPSANQRTDVWGGEIQGRGRFALEAARRAAAAIGADRVGVRLSPYGVFNDIVPWETVHDDFTWLAGEFGKLGLLYLHIVDHSAMGAPPVSDDTKAAMRAAFGGPVILSGGYDRERADADLGAVKGELVAFGRPYLANPDLVRRLQEGVALNAPDFATFYTPGPKGYTDYPTLG